MPSTQQERDLIAIPKNSCDQMNNKDADILLVAPPTEEWSDELDMED